MIFRSTRLGCTISITQVMGMAVFLVAGCSSGSSDGDKSQFTDRQQKALKDPMGYTPANHDPRSAEEAAKQKKERSDTLKGDWDRLWNP